MVALLVASTGMQALGSSLDDRAGDGDDAPARALPSQVVVCVDRSAARCFTAASEGDCRSTSGAEVFRVLSRGDGSVAHGSALAECWQSVGKAP
jgi:hypothetical protein